MSWAEVTWPSAVRPQALTNRVSFIPSSCARAFIICTKASSLPARCSPSATAQSLAETTATHFSISATVSTSPSSSQIWLPPMEAAWAEAVTGSSREMRPWSTASHTSSMVITLVTLAGSRTAWASFSSSTAPSRVISTAEGACTATAGAAGPSSAAQGTANIMTTSTAASILFIKHTLQTRFLLGFLCRPGRNYCNPGLFPLQYKLVIC